jgi:hypothetical protein
MRAVDWKYRLRMPGKGWERARGEKGCVWTSISIAKGADQDGSLGLVAVVSYSMRTYGGQQYGPHDLAK